MIKGVTKEEEIIIQDILVPYKEEYDFFYYGSRVKGNFEKMSDLDILIKGNNSFPLKKLELIKILFDNSDLPYVVNFTDYYNIDDKFYSLIEKDLIKVLI